MLVRNGADYRTLLWVCFMAGAATLHYAFPGSGLWLFPISAYLAISAGVIAHNHNHRPIFASRRLNVIFNNVISVFYGYPIFAWVPTHNRNHHRFVNRPGDATITWRYSNRNNWWVAATYFLVSSYWQSDPIRGYIREARQNNRRLYRSIVTQYGVWAGSHALLLGLACAVFGIGRGVVVWLLALGLPALISLWTIMLFNYIQHVHADAWSESNHSRNFTGTLLNFLLFNNGYHAAHHLRPSAHWSTLPELHARLAPQIHPDLKQRSFWWFVVKTYVLAPFLPHLGTRQLGRAPFDGGVQAEETVALAVGD